MTTERNSHPATHTSLRAQKGLTLVELMVSLVIGLVVVLAASTALVISRNGFNSVDAAAQLRDSARFAEDVLQRLGVQAGFEDLANSASPPPPNIAALQGASANVPNVFVYGLNNSLRKAGDAWVDASGGSGVNGSDVLVLRFQPNVSSVNTASSDSAMIDCSGMAPQGVPTDPYDRVTNVLYVSISPSDNEPTLMCAVWPLGGGSASTPQPLVKGVEDFQVLYGVDGIPAGNKTMPAASSADNVTERYLRADQLTVAGNNAVTAANWQRVRSIRIGMVLRASANSAVDRSTQQTFYPLGIAASSGGAAGSLFSDTNNDAGSSFTPAPDGRLRQVVTFTVHLRNPQGTS